MQLYRISNEKYASDLSGTGGLYYAGRWHYKGSRIIYFSEHISLAKLELLANALVLPKNMSLITVEVPSGSVQHVDLSMLPHGRDDYPYIEQSQDIGEQWLKQGKKLMLKVPSAQSAMEYNYLINPLHKEAQKIKIVSIDPIKFDQRLKL